MARFVWRLQRVLDIREKEELVLRSELMALSERMVVLRQEIMVIRARIHSALEELGYKEPSERLSSQQLFMKYSEYSEIEIDSLRSQLSNVDRQRKEKMNEILKKRQSIKALEKLRARAKEEYLADSAHKEQNELDEYTKNKFGRRSVVSA
ncbi:MAG: flagellar FliJ family protein [Phycisphaerae bacterium]|nr:flagellar FliJ family protein [Phycisphaerae bacterium]